ncbi:hypothetical protein ACEPAG_1434 [Sanghuangporus baumii]
MVTEEKPRREMAISAREDVRNTCGVVLKRLSKSTVTVMEIMPNAKNSSDLLKTSRAQRHEVLVALLLPPSLSHLSTVYYAPNTHIISSTANKLARRDENDGGLKTSTKLGIVIGLICFFTILISFWFIWRLRKKPQATTEDDIFAQETLARWEENVLHGRRYPELRGNALRDQGRTRRASESTLATYTSYDTGDDVHLSKPKPAHIIAHL